MIIRWRPAYYRVQDRSVGFVPASAWTFVTMAEPSAVADVVRFTLHPRTVRFDPTANSVTLRAPRRTVHPERT